MKKNDLRDYTPADRVFRHLTTMQIKLFIADGEGRSDAVVSHTLMLLQAELAERGEA
jgi:hypothetical protein